MSVIFIGSNSATIDDYLKTDKHFNYKLFKNCFKTNKPEFHKKVKGHFSISMTMSKRTSVGKTGDTPVYSLVLKFMKNSVSVILIGPKS